MAHSHVLALTAAYVAILLIAGSGVTVLVARVIARGTRGVATFIGGFVAKRAGAG